MEKIEHDLVNNLPIGYSMDKVLANGKSKVYDYIFLNANDFNGKIF